jgi:hypothetical protein
MNRIVLILFASFSFSIARAQSGSHLDPELRIANDTTLGAVLELEVAINSIRLLKMKSDSVFTPKQAVFPKGSSLKLTEHTNSYQSGSVKIFFAFNQEKEQRYHKPVRLTAIGRHTVKVRVVAEGGRESLLELSFQVIE